MASKPEIEPQTPVIVQTGLQEGDVTSKTSEIREPISDEKTEADATVTLSGDDDIINQVRDSTFRFNQAEFERKMRELSASSDLPPVDAPAHDALLTSRRESLEKQKQKHDSWMENFQQKKRNVLERLGIIMSNKTERFHRAYDIVLTPRTVLN